MRINLPTFSLIFAFILSGCADAPDTLDSGTPDLGLSIQGMVADGYITGAKVCLDLNDNKDCDTGEPTTETDQTGSYTLENISEDDKRNHSIVVKVTTSSVDLDTPGVPVDKEFTLTAPPGSTGFISPLTSLWKIAMDANASLDSIAAENAILSTLGLIGFDFSLSDDFLNASTNGELAIYAHTLAMAITDLVQINIEATRTEANDKGASPTEEEIVNLALLEALDRISDLSISILDLIIANGKPPTPIEVYSLVESSSDLKISFVSYTLIQQLSLLERRMASTPVPRIDNQWPERFSTRLCGQPELLVDEPYSGSVPCYTHSGGTTIFWIWGDGTKTEAVEKPNTWVTLPDGSNTSAHVFLRDDGELVTYPIAGPLNNEIIDNGNTSIYSNYALDDNNREKPVEMYRLGYSKINPSGLKVNQFTHFKGWQEYLKDSTATFESGDIYYQRQTESLIDRTAFYHSNYDELKAYMASPTDNAVLFSELEKAIVDQPSLPSTFPSAADLALQDYLPGCAGMLISNGNDIIGNGLKICPATIEEMLNAPDTKISDKGAKLVLGPWLYDGNGQHHVSVFLLRTDHTVTYYSSWTLGDVGRLVLDMKEVDNTIWTEKSVNGASTISIIHTPKIKRMRRLVGGARFVKIGNFVRAGGLLPAGDSWDFSYFNSSAIEKMKAEINCNSGKRSDGVTPWCQAN